MEDFTERQLEKLTPLEDCIIRMRYGLPYRETRTLDFVGKAFDVTRERVRQVEEKVLRRILKARGKDGKLDERLIEMRGRLHEALDDHEGCKFNGCEYRRR